VCVCVCVWGGGASCPSGILFIVLILGMPSYGVRSNLEMMWISCTPEFPRMINWISKDVVSLLELRKHTMSPETVQWPGIV